MSLCIAITIKHKTQCKYKKKFGDYCGHHKRVPVIQPVVPKIQPVEILKKLRKSSEEYKEASELWKQENFMESKKAITNSNRQIIEIFSVSNKDLSDRFEKIQEETKETPVWKWHGSRYTSLKSICNNGFWTPDHKNYIMANRTIFGRGVYLSPFKSIRLRYSDNHILICKVLYGKKGKYINREEREITKCDSFETSNKSVFVGFDSNKLLPVYLISYSRNGID